MHNKQAKQHVLSVQHYFRNYFLPSLDLFILIFVLLLQVIPFIMPRSTQGLLNVPTYEFDGRTTATFQFVMQILTFKKTHQKTTTEKQLHFYKSN